MTHSRIICFLCTEISSNYKLSLRELYENNGVILKHANINLFT